MRLDKDGCRVRINAGGKVHPCGVDDVPTQLLRLLRDRDGMQVHNAKNCTVIALQRDPIFDRTEIISDVNDPARLNPRKKSLCRHMLQLFTVPCSLSTVRSA